MSDLDKEQQRAVRNKPNCDFTAPETAPFFQPTATPRKTDPCDPAAPDLAPLYVDPAAPRSPDAAALTPAIVAIGNDQLVVQCSDLQGAGPVGAPVVMLESTSTQFLSLLDFGIDGARLTVLADLVTSGRIVDLLLGSVSDLIAASGITGDQADALHAAAVAAKQAMNAAAREVALGLLICGWPSAEITLNCPSGALLSSQQLSTPYRVSNPVVLVAGTITATTSQDAADVQARTLAETLLSCVYGNSDQTATCADTSIPNDQAASPSGYQRTGRSTVAANTVFSDIDQDTADRLALAQAAALLHCGYLNQPAQLQCADVGLAGADQTTPGSVTTGTRGNPIVIDAGYFASEISQADADAQAVAAANALLACSYLNAPVTARCPDQSVTVNGITTIYPAASNSPVPVVFIEAGQFASSISQLDADQQALQAAQMQLTCLYCNQPVLPTCVPAAVLASVIAGTTTLPLQLSDVTPEWSPDATLGVAGNSFCDGDAVAAQAMAATVLNIPIRALRLPSTECSQGNDALYAICKSTGFTLVTPPENYDVSVKAGEFTFSDSQVPVDFMPGNAGRTKSYANSVALDFLRALAACSYGSAGVKMLCGDPANADTIVSTYTNGGKTYNVYGGGSMTPTDASAGSIPVDATSDGSVTNPVLIDPGAWNSTISQADADTKAREAAKALLNCGWTNVSVSLTCGAPLTIPWTPENNTGTPVTAGDGGWAGGGSVAFVVTSPGSPASPAMIDAGEFFDKRSKKLATKAAYDICYQMLNCLWGNFAVTGGCGPTALNPSSITIPQDTILSHISVRDATNTATAMVSGVACVYGNDAQSITKSCPDTSTAVGPTTVPADTFVAGTKAEANAVAAQYLASLNHCIENGQDGGNGGAGKPGPPGKDGGQTNCTGECFAIYK